MMWRTAQIKTILYILLAIVSFGACQLINKAEEDNRLLAKVHNKTLYLSELDGMFPESTTSQDSALIINAFVERWVREALLLHEAEKNIPSDLNIDKLVRDYRASLVRHNYEKIIIEQLLDSTVTAEELLDFYTRHQEQYQLEGSIVRCYFVKVPQSAPDLDRLRRLWNNNSNQESYFQLVDYCTQNANAHLLEKDAWYRIEDIAAEFPPGVVGIENASRREITHRDEDYQYFLEIFEVKNQNEIAPLVFVEDEIRKMILRNRKIKLLEDKKEEMYELELRRNNIQIYTQ
ncbi:MAG: hypothetical protein SFU99_21770 [Saprospiraceae bacterium]|nr:hypothetical protein [Saprospiraceae bacterium]